MAYSDDAAEQVVKIALEGTEFAARITGEGAKQAAVLLYALLKDQKRTKGKTRLTRLLREGKELRVFTVKDKDLQLFCQQAKKYGVLYCVLKDKNANDGLTEIMAKAEDAAKINRIFERNELTTVDMDSVQNEIEQAVEDRTADDPEPLRPNRRGNSVDRFVDAVLQKPQQEVHDAVPSQARTESEAPSAPTSETSTVPGDRTSIRKKIQEIREEMAAEPAIPHITPERIQIKGKER